MVAEGREQVTRIGIVRVNGQPEELDGPDGRRQPSKGGTSRVSREAQARICERLGVKFPGPTRPRGEIPRADSAVISDGHPYRNPERRLEGRNGRAAPGRPKDQISDSVVHNLLEPKNGLDFGVHLTQRRPRSRVRRLVALNESVT